MPVLLDVVVIYTYLRSIVVVIPNGQILDCATAAFSERYEHGEEKNYNVMKRMEMAQNRAHL
jgi:hypothetical protein